MVPHIEERLSAEDILRRPYHRVVVPDEDGSFSAEISEFPGCIAVGDTATDALTILEEVAIGWLEAALANNQEIPTPTEEPEYSGKTVLRLPKSLHRQAAHAAKREGVSLNQYIVTALATFIGASDRPVSSAPALVQFTNVITQVQMPVTVIDLSQTSRATPLWQNYQVGQIEPVKRLVNG